MTTQSSIFHQFREILPPERKAAWDIIVPYMYDPTDPVKNHPGIINQDLSHHQGGTWLNNYNLTVTEANVVVEIIKEFECSCLFIFPFPSITSLAIAISPNVARLASQRINLAMEFPTHAPIPPYFSVHMNGGSNACRDKYKQLAIQVMACSPEYNTEMGSKEGSYEKEIEGIAAQEIKKIMMIRKE